MVKQIAALYLLSQTEKRCILEKEVKIEVFKNESKDIEVSGITVGCYFLSQEEELSIIEQIEGFDWKQSQSGRLKQVSIFFLLSVQNLVLPNVSETA